MGQGSTHGRTSFPSLSTVLACGAGEGGPAVAPERIEEPASDEPGTDGAETTVTIGGESWTCETITRSGQCGPESQAVFDQYGNNIDLFVNSGELGPLNDFDEVIGETDDCGELFLYYEDVAFAGLVACTFSPGGEEQFEEFIGWMRRDGGEALASFSGTELLPVWFEAHKRLCPEGHKSGDYTVP